MLSNLKGYLLSVLTIVVASATVSASDDVDGLWLVYDVSQLDYSLLRIRMDGFRRGTATFPGTNTTFVGRRPIKGPAKGGAIPTVFLDGTNLTISHQDRPVMVGSINLQKGEISGRFAGALGSGIWVASRQPENMYQAQSVFQYCDVLYALSGGGANSRECLNITTSVCDDPFLGSTSSFLSLDSCRELMREECYKFENPHGYSRGTCFDNGWTKSQ